MCAYRLADAVAPHISAELPTADTLIHQLLVNRGITTKQEAEVFLNPDYETGRHDPFLMHDMEKAVVRIQEAIEAKEHIAIFADYDCDGIPGAVVLHDFFRTIEYEHVIHYIPHRHYEGFGLSVSAVDKLREQGVTLIITVDCGTSDIEAITYATTCGIDVIVTDHHEPPKVVPSAYALVNPKVGDTYPFQGLCGAGVVFKLVEALIARGSYTFTEGYEKWWLDMVGVATICDMVPLVGENRVFARYGLEVLRKSRRPGLQQLFKKARANQRFITEDDIGFIIGPRINAASRMDTPDDAFHMLSARDESEAWTYVDHLERLNNERKGIVASMTKELKKRIGEMVSLPDVLVVGSPEWKPSLAGLAANSLAETYGRPAFVWGRDGNGVIKGSCRSEGSTSVVALMNEIADAFIEHGGHHMSGGFSVKDDAIHTLAERMNKTYQELGTNVYVSEDVYIDASLTLDMVGPSLVQSLAQLAPYGVGNPKPVFQFKDVQPQSVSQFGKAKEHLKLVFQVGNHPIEAIAFFANADTYATTPVPETSITLLAHVEQSFFMGRQQIRLRIVDIV